MDLSGLSRPRHQWWRFPIVVALLSVACDSAAPPTPTFTVRDSAGVQIVESTAPAWAPGDAWTVGAEPAVHIGVIEGSEEYQFTIIGGVWRVPDGGFVVADTRSAEVRFFDADGMFRGSFGRQGDGPGEFRRLIAAYPYRGDSIAVWDGRRLSVFDHGGQLGRTLTPSLTRPFPPRGDGGPMVLTGSGLQGLFPDGALLASPGMIVRITPTPGLRIPQETTLMRYSAEGDSLQSVGPFPEPELVMPAISVLGGVRLGSPFTRRVVYFPGSLGLYVGASKDLEVQRFGSDGVLDFVIRASHRSLVLTEEHRDMFKDSERERLAESASPEELERALASVEFPETVPPYSQLLVDSEDHLWVRDYKIRGTSGPEVWGVFSPEGQLLGTLETPERLQVRQIGVDFILGIWTDELDVRYVRMYTLERG